MKKDLKKGDTFWVMVDTSFNFDPKNRIKSESIWTEDEVERFCKNESHPRRVVKVKVIESKGYWKKLTE